MSHIMLLAFDLVCHFQRKSSLSVDSTSEMKRNICVEKKLEQRDCRESGGWVVGGGDMQNFVVCCNLDWMSIKGC